MSCRFVGREDIEILIGGHRDGFEFVVQREALERLVQLGQQALASPAEEDTDDPNDRRLAREYKAEQVRQLQATNDVAIVIDDDPLVIERLSADGVPVHHAT